MMTETLPAKVLDAKGLKCPEPVMMLHKEIRALAVGELLEVQATDPSTRRDISRFCEFLHHELLELREDGEMLVFLIRKGQKKRDV